MTNRLWAVYCWTSKGRKGMAHRENKKATASANAMAGTRVDSGRLNLVTAEFVRLFSEACS